MVFVNMCVMLQLMKEQWLTWYLLEIWSLIVYTVDTYDVYYSDHDVVYRKLNFDE